MVSVISILALITLQDSDVPRPGACGFCAIHRAHNSTRLRCSRPGACGFCAIHSAHNSTRLRCSRPGTCGFCGYQLRS